MSDNTENLKSEVEQLRNEIYGYEIQVSNLEYQLQDAIYRYGELEGTAEDYLMLKDDIKDLLQDLSRFNDISARVREILNNFFWKNISEKLG